jgi:hypothetical protein
MNESQEQFCQRLMAADQATPEFKAKYEREMHMLFVDQTIKGKAKRVLTVQLTISLMAGIVSGALAAFGPKSIVPSSLMRTLLGVSAPFFFGMAIYLIHLMKRGKVNMGTYNLPLENLGWFMNIAVFGIFAGFCLRGSRDKISLLVFATGVLLFAGVNKIMQDVKRAELRTRTKLLQLEWQFADLREKLGSKGD